ncbi:transcriptional regulator [Rhodanobacter sp. FW510-R12]|uniref:ArsR/SmtB family transcription factor n=1 Tax=unclassified Rhodanobacter TaxID=2621553 RepID=UPI0007A9ACB1|nr:MULTISPECIES: metalloregulator ArsR/SmtB family transcription factor [unclassified Rhodanobacter]KZC15387.1 transcriptional regulator [Rhodanobacter sp. FW104-R8]KZC25522.1 transcriptional regulator [Rhodanobacter sp. FW510-T8]KZC31113.1 transcriptional regulator [Rhodanobacter sp. FW510-R10]
MNLPANADLNLMQARAEEATRLLKALGNAQRLRVLCLLLDGEMQVNQINERLPELSQSALSQHLARLRDEGLVSTRREAQSVWYTLPQGPAHDIMATLYGIYCATGGGRRAAKKASARALHNGRRAGG